MENGIIRLIRRPKVVENDTTRSIQQIWLWLPLEFFSTPSQLEHLLFREDNFISYPSYFLNQLALFGIQSGIRYCHISQIRV